METVNASESKAIAAASLIRLPGCSKASRVILLAKMAL